MGGPMISEKKWGDLPFLGVPIDLLIILGGPVYPFSKKMVTSLFRQIERSVKKDHCLFQSRHELMTLFPGPKSLENWKIEGQNFPQMPMKVHESFCQI